MAISSILRGKGHEVVSLTPDSTVADVVETLVQRRIGALLVIELDEPVGIVSERDIVRCLGAHGVTALQMRVRDVMTAPLITISPDDSIPSAMELMTDRRIRHLPVLDSGRLVGLVSIGDLVKRRIEEAEQEALALKDYIATA
ncbi:CBS domain-containing protein [Sandaracinobacter sp.]|jgi:CBS domain-containing protein|uniref:CBS domain-containing protein n=1 Tax=Sandaracinobacter sp. TaxID=2487581 RepID=UPI0035B22CA1